MHTAPMFKRFIAALCVSIVALTGIFPLLTKAAHAHMTPAIARNMSLADKLRTAANSCRMPPIAALPHAQPAALTAHSSSAISAPVISTFAADGRARAAFIPEQSPSNRIRAPNAAGAVA